MNLRSYWFILFLILYPALVQAQELQMKFEHLSLDEGLSQTSVTCILQDSRGFMWFGTEDGLNKYDGYKFTVYRHIPGDSTSLSSSYITSLLEDKNGVLWIGTNIGLNRYDRRAEIFQHFQKPSTNQSSVSGYADRNYINCLVEDNTTGALWLGTQVGLDQFDKETGKFISYGDYYVRSIQRRSDGKFWIGTYGQGLCLFDKNTGGFTLHKLPKHHPQMDIQSLLLDKNGTLWIGTNEGLYDYDQRNQSSDLIRFYPDDIPGQYKNGVQTLYKSESGHIWIGTNGGGLIKLDVTTKDFQAWVNDPNDPLSINWNNVTALYQGTNGVLWVGSFGRGIDKFDPHQWKFEHHRGFDLKTNSSNGSSVRAFTEDQSGLIWIGSHDGLSHWDRKTGLFGHFEHEPSDPQSISSNTIRSLFVDKNGTLWIGNWSEGLNRFDKQLQQVKRYDKILSDSIAFARINCFAEEDSGNLWIGGTGLVNFNPQSKQFQRFLPENIITRLYHDSNGMLWIGTSNDGLICFDPDSKIFTRYEHRRGHLLGLSHNFATSIIEGDPGTLWVGTYGGGLNKLDTKTGRFKHYNTTDGLPNDVIYGILKDDHGLLWISSNKGICHFNPATETFKAYGVEDGLQSNEFNAGAYYKSKSGEMFFGGINGFNVFHPDSIQDNYNIPQIVFTDFQIFNKPVPIGMESPLQRSISEVDQISLAHNQSVFSFEFVALNYTHPEKNQYAYMLKGFDQDWQYLGNRNFITFTNLDPGEYTLRVKGSNNDGIWNEAGATIRLVITPPWWRTWWAYILYSLGFLAVLLVLRGQVISRERLKSKHHLEHLQLERLQEVDEMKSRFFANLSHEFRTPLTFILGTTEKALAKSATGSKEKQGYGLIHRSAQRLLSLINQLLDLSKLEAGSMRLQAGNYDLIGFLKPMAAAFGSLAQSREIHFITNFPYDHLDLYFDQDKMEKIVNNLLANAFKFTAKKGHVAITVSKHTADETENTSFAQGFVKITIKDNGEGISQDQLEKIFDRFYQVNDSLTREHEGSGIGLALCKELVELHRGEIQVESHAQKGSTFKVLLPLGRDHLKESEIVSDPVVTSPVPRVEKIQAARQFESSDSKLATVLIVEDNGEMQDYLADILGDHYLVTQASNGREALTMLRDNLPDLIISDVMMPKMDGITFCKELKKNEATNHIPVIMLTARADQRSKEEGLEIGADSYLTKPFGTKELLVRVKNLLSQRELLKDRFKREVILEPKRIAITSKEENFLNKVMESIEQHLGDEHFNLDQLADEVGLSKPQMTKKLNTLTDHTPNQLIQKFRLDRAKELLEKDAGSIAEIAYEVGFSSPAYFTKVFKEKFGMAPRAFKNSK